MEKFKSGVNPTTDSSPGTISKTGPAAPALQIAALPEGDYSTSPATADSPFYKLPVELRLHILKAAFGGRTVHIGYEGSSGIPGIPFPVSQPKAGFSTEYHCAWGPWRAKHPDKTWFGCVCHRLHGGELCFGVNLVRDQCLLGRADCWDFDGEIPYKCRIGVMGWLLSCRQAYREVLDVLYASNTFHISPDYYYDWPADPCPAFRSIKSLELVAFDPRPMPVHSKVMTVIQKVPSTFPALQRLYIGFGGGIYNTEKRGPRPAYLRFTEEMLPLVDDLARQYAPGPLNLEVGVPGSVFRASWWVGMGRGMRFQAPDCPGPGWRSLGGFFERKRVWRAVIATEDGGEDEKSGYWLSETESDIPSWWARVANYWE